MDIIKLMKAATLTRIAVLAAAGILGGTGIASLRPLNLEGHRSSLLATATMTDGTIVGITLQGVGCDVSMCSRVAIQTADIKRMWLDGLMSISEISHNPTGPVTAAFRFRNGVERKESIGSGNRVLYVRGRFGSTKKLDLATLSRLDFYPTSK